jgi:hypothetical protein
VLVDEDLYTYCEGRAVFSRDDSITELVTGAISLPLFLTNTVQ